MWTPPLPTQERMCDFRLLWILEYLGYRQYPLLPTLHHHHQAPLSLELYFQITFLNPL